jgi:curved DNA-binding protein CbpA
MADFYKLLNVPRTATLSEIKTAYRKLALQLHPDKTNGDSAKTARYRVVAQAYATLSDTNLRQEYDRQHGLRTINAGRTGRSNSRYNNFAYAPERILDPSAPFNEQEWYAAHYPPNPVIIVNQANVSFSQLRNSMYKNYYMAQAKNSNPPVVNTEATMPTKKAQRSGASSKDTNSGQRDNASIFHARKEKRQMEAAMRQQQGVKSTDFEYKVDTRDEYRKKTQDEGCCIQ